MQPAQAFTLGQTNAKVKQIDVLPQQMIGR
jgi:hypothetical protein